MTGVLSLAARRSPGSAGTVIRLAAVVASAAALGCGGANPSLAVDSLFRATGAQFVSGELAPDDQAAGPQVHTIASANNRLYPGVQNKAIAGSVESTATAVAVGLGGDDGYWIIPTGIVDLNSPPDLTFSTRGSFSPTLPAGNYNLVFRAVDAQGQLGPAKIQSLTLAAAPVDGFFVISLLWGGPADLDLHVIAPATGGPGTEEIWTKKRNSLSSKRTLADGPFTPEEIAAAGVLDFDSNAGCALDGRNNENVVWMQRPPAGHYIVRVDAASLCGASSVVWGLQAYFDDMTKPVFEISGQFGETATAVPHVAGAGLTVWEQDVL